MRAAVVGAGAWGTALATVLARGGGSAREVLLWAHEADVVESINRERRNRFLPGIDLPDTLIASADLEQTVSAAELVVFAPPSHVLRALSRRVSHAIGPRATLVVASKGIEEDTLAIMTDVVAGEVPGRPVVALSGPSFAAEVAVGQPTAVVAASRDGEAARRTQEALSSEQFRVYTHDDVTGVELGGSLKNVMAVATGIAEGVGLGYNSRAGLITRGLAEMTRLGVALGARPETFAGLAGLGDLVLTCTGSLSRNLALGVALGQGRSLSDALAGKDTVAEGVRTTRSASALARRERVDMPIVTAVHRILFDGEAPRAAISALMARELRAEQDE
ncbi:MAG TPA: NAD(P)H-dependent glycerol-3-phosphate dehydrogenase [Gemmatimonadaceae bacterium]|nr:NAD(P)H-dependent glycerol-3-phosphate dehydrogenase [Gemmatimonadaceae bacterium]